MIPGFIGGSPGKWRRFMLALSLLLVLVAGVPLDHPALASVPVRVGVYENKPLVFRRGNGDWAGLTVDVLKQIASEEGWYLHFIAGTWSQCLQRLEAGELDLLVSIAYSKTRSGRFDFSSETVFTNWGIFYTRQGITANSILDLEGRSVAVLKSDIHTRAFLDLLKRFNLHCTLLELDRYTDIFRLLQKGRADAGLVNRVFGDRNEDQYRLTKTNIVFNPIEVRYAAPKGKGGVLLPALDRNLRRMKEDQDSVYYRLMEQWLAGSAAVRVVPSWLEPLLLGSGGILLGLAALALVLRWQVKKKTSELVRANRALRENEAYVRSILRAAPVGIGLLLDRRFQEVNETLCEMLGYRAEELLGRNVRIVYPDSDEYEWVGREKHRQMEESGTGMVETRWCRKDGTVIDVLLSSAPLDPADRSTAVTFTVLDITHQVRAVKELKRLRSLLSNIIDSMPSILVGVDRSGSVTTWNREAVRVTGMAAEQVREKSLSEVFPPLAQDMERVRLAIQSRSTQTQQKVVREIGGEKRLTDVTVYPLLTNGADGAVIRIDDVTERVRLEERMIQSEKMVSVGGLAAGMAHEVNNPLAAILQNAQNALRRTTEDLPANVRVAEECGTRLESIREYVERRGVERMLRGVIEAGRRAADLVQNMLSFSRKNPPIVSTHDLAELLERTMSLASSDYDLKKKYDFRRIQVIRDYDPDCPPVPCEGSKMQQVFFNILKNGAEAMRDSAGPDHEPCFRLRTRCDGVQVRVDIEDNGPGMSEEVRRRVFEPFFTTKEAGAGTGLGLSVSYFIVTQNHGGTMTVSSTPGRGTTFSIQLPLVRGGKS